MKANKDRWGDAAPTDRAGAHYWEDVWRQRKEIYQPLDPHDTSLAAFARLRLARLFAEILGAQSGAGRKLLEIGCGGSRWLPFYRQHLGFDVHGLDYSPTGVAQTEEILARAGVPGTIILGDLFHPPLDLVHRFDAVVSMGVIEHFPDYTGCIRAMAQFLAPGGTMITEIPNIAGWLGSIERILDRAVYDVHVPITRDQLRTAHLDAGLEVEDCFYFLGSNWAVLHASSWSNARARAVAHRALGRMARVCWWIESRFGWPGPNQRTSPYIVCVARRPTVPPSGE